MASTLARPTRGRMIAGVCAALADRFGIGVGKIRLVFIIFGLFGAGEIAYIALWILVPKQGRA